MSYFNEIPNELIHLILLDVNDYFDIDNFIFIYSIGNVELFYMNLFKRDFDYWYPKIKGIMYNKKWQDIYLLFYRNNMIEVRHDHELSYRNIIILTIMREIKLHSEYNDIHDKLKNFINLDWKEIYNIVDCSHHKIYKQYYIFYDNILKNDNGVEIFEILATNIKIKEFIRLYINLEYMLNYIKDEDKRIKLYNLLFTRKTLTDTLMNCVAQNNYEHFAWFLRRDPKILDELLPRIKNINEELSDDAWRKMPKEDMIDYKSFLKNVIIILRDSGDEKLMEHIYKQVSNL